MTAHDPIEIHEFSTGIQIEKTETGWVSGGFTTKYMNQTIDPIPPGVLEAISNREFALAEGASSQIPAMVGREVIGHGTTWSVVAVVARGMDNFGRGVSLYRYFLCEGQGQIETILRWMGNAKVFDPSDKKVLRQPNQYTPNPGARQVNLDHRPELQALLGQSPPIIVPASQKCTALILDQMTQQLSPEGGRSWACNVAALEHPEYFQVIYPTDAKAENLLRRVLSSRPSRPTLVAGDPGIRKAIKAVVDNRLKAEHMRTLDNALNNPQVDKEYWQEVLNQEGADQAQKEKLYDDRYIRLLTLKSILRPGFLFDFLGWLANSKESKKNYVFSLNFQEKILKLHPNPIATLPQITENVKRGICILFTSLISQPQIIKEACYLLMPSSNSWGLWAGLCKYSLYPDMEYDLNLMVRYAHNTKGLDFKAMNKYEEWRALFERIKSFWVDDRYTPQRQYLPLAQLLRDIEEYQLSALFYQISEGNVPKAIYRKVIPENAESTVFGLAIAPRRSLGDIFDIDIAIGDSKIPLGVFSRISIVAFLLGGVVGGVGGWGAHNAITSGNVNITWLNLNINPFNSRNRSENIPNEETHKHTSLSPENSYKYDQTERAIADIINRLDRPIRNAIANQKIPEEIPKGLYKSQSADKKKYVENIVKFSVKKQLNFDSLQYIEIVKNDNNWKTFSNAIEKYQEDKQVGTIDGFITPGQKTQELLEKDILSYLGLPASDK